jgi:hypothetical protein
MRASVLRFGSALFALVGLLALSAAVFSASGDALADEPINPPGETCGCEDECYACTNSNGFCGSPRCPQCECIQGDGFNFVCILDAC